MATDGESKINFVNALRYSGAQISDIFVIFFYDIFPGVLEGLRKSGIELHYLCTWHDILKLARSEQYFDKAVTDSVENFLNDPISWSENNGGRKSID